MFQPSKELPITVAPKELGPFLAAAMRVGMAQSVETHRIYREVIDGVCYACAIGALSIGLNLPARHGWEARDEIFDRFWDLAEEIEDRFEQQGQSREEIARWLETQ